MRRSFLCKPATILIALCSVMAFGAASAAHAAPQTATRGMAHVIAHHGFNATSTNWSGYATTGTTYSDVKGTWVQPTAHCSVTANGYSSFWVGIDGDGTNSVEQLGTDSDCSNGTAKYYGWWEMYPNPSYDLSTSTYHVSPGDTLTAEVHYNGSGSFTLTMSSSRGWKFSTTKTSTSAARGSAEWIAEAPSSYSGVLPLADFGTVNFSSCTANGKVISANPNVVSITMTTSGGTTKAKPSGLNSSGNGFSDTWYHS